MSKVIKGLIKVIKGSEHLKVIKGSEHLKHDSYFSRSQNT
jgi:hypothetical protein